MGRDDDGPTPMPELGDATTTQALTRRYAERLLGDAREELHRADTKGSILMASTGAVILAFVTAILAGGWSPARLTGIRELLWWAGTAMAASAMLLMGAAIYPRTGRRGIRPSAFVAYYRDVASFREPAALWRALEQAAPRELDQLTDQLLYLSRLVLAKYRLLAVGMWAMLAAVSVCCLASGLQPPAS